MTGRALIVSLLLGTAACASAPGPGSRDLRLVFTREGGGRAAVTALAFVDGGRRIAIGDFRGGLELLDPASGDVTPVPVDGAGGEILALGRLGGELVPVRRGGEPFGWGRLTGALADEQGRFVGWSRLTRSLHAAGRRDARVDGVAIAAAAMAGDDLFLLRGRAPEETLLERRAFPGLEPVWSVDPGPGASALAADAVSRRLVVSRGSELEVRTLADGALGLRVAAPPSIPHSLRDGRRFLLVQHERLAVLDLDGGAGGPRLDPAFEVHRGGITAAAVSADGSRIATGGARGDVRLFELRPIDDLGVLP